MTSLPVDFTLRVGSLGSASSVREAIASYRRAQYFLSNSNVPSSPELSESRPDEEAGVPFDNERASTPSPYDPSQSYDGFVGDLGWDEDDIPTPRPLPTGDEPSERHLTLPMPTRPFQTRLSKSPTPVYPAAGEGTPLLRKSVSFSSVPRPGLDNSLEGPQIESSTEQSTQGRRAPTQPTSNNVPKNAKHDFGGRSTFGQTLYNSVAILLGIGILSEPVAFSYAGWIGGSFLIIFYGYITCYTAKVLAHIILDDPRLRSYADIGRKAFGPKSMPLTSAMFCLELFAVSVALVTLYADSLHTIIPTYSADLYKLCGLVVLVPTVFLPLSMLSYTSILGIISTLFLVAVIAIDGLSKKDSPGSLWSPAQTNIGVESIGELGIAYGLFMAGFSGHAVIPSLARDMIDPGQFDLMIDWAFFIATVIYAFIGTAGYLMFGRSVHDEISQDLLGTPGYNPLLNKIALWMLVINPLSKFALATRPLNVTLEIMLGLETTAPLSPEEDHNLKTASLSTHSYPRTDRHLLKRVLMVVERVSFTFLSVGVSILIPQFSSVMAFLGSFSAFVLCVIGPVAAKVALQGRCGVWDAFLLVVGVVMAVWGTGAAFWSTT